MAALAREPLIALPRAISPAYFDGLTEACRAAGFEPGRDIEIRFSGIRPGEKLYEEMFWGHEEAVPTLHPKILCSREKVAPSALICTSISRSPVMTTFASTPASLSSG